MSDPTQSPLRPSSAAAADPGLVDPTVHLPAHVRLEPGVRVENGVIFASGDGAETTLRAGVRIEAGAVIGSGLEIGHGALVRPGAVVLSSVPANAIASGNPAQIVGYTTELPADASAALQPHAAPGNRPGREVHPLNVGGAALYHMPQVIDLRGNLTVGEFDAGFPFEPKRYFAVFGVPSEKLRGEHAHYRCHQFLICIAGSCRALLDDGQNRQEVVLDRPDVGLYMPPMIWGTQYRYSQDAVLLVFASHGYDAGDYIRTYAQFQAALASAPDAPPAERGPGG